MNKYFLDLNKFPEGKIFDKMREYASEKKVPIINDEGLAFLLFIIKITKAKNILEIGTAIGFSAINMASLGNDIVIDTIERDKNMFLEATKNVVKANYENRINIYNCDALEFDESLLGNKKYDLIFIDAAKAQYIKFFEKYEKYLSTDGVIFTDNLLFHGLINNSTNIESKNLRNLVLKIEKFNEWLKNNENYNSSFFDIGDGIAISKRCIDE